MNSLCPRARGCVRGFLWGVLLGVLPSLAGAEVLEKFLGWMTGDFNNQEQVWQQDIDGAALSPHLHTSFTRAQLTSSAAAVVRMEDFAGEFQGAFLGQRLLLFYEEGDGLRMESYLPRTQGRGDLYWPQDWRPLKGCGVRWVLEEGRFVGRLLNPSRCQRAAAREQVWALAPQGASLGETVLNFYYERYDKRRGIMQQYHSSSRKVRWFRGWIAVLRDHLDPDSVAPEDAADEWVFHCGLRTHNEGWRFPMVTKDGKDSGYEVQLARLTQQEAQIAVLVLKLFRQGEDKAFSYAWADVDAKRLGINLRWIQTGWTAEPGRNSC